MKSKFLTFFGSTLRSRGDHSFTESTSKKVKLTIFSFFRFSNLSGKRKKDPSFQKIVLEFCPRLSLAKFKPHASRDNNTHFLNRTIFHYFSLFLKFQLEYICIYGDKLNSPETRELFKTCYSKNNFH